jgi:hypothetical protein
VGERGSTASKQKDKEKNSPWTVVGKKAKLATFYPSL